MYLVRRTLSAGPPRITSLLLLPLLTALLAGCSLFPEERSDLAPPLVEPVQPSYRTVPVERGTMQTALQMVATFESASVVFHPFLHTGGRVSEVLVAVGDMVEAGDPLIRLDYENLELELLGRRLAMLEAEDAVLAAHQGGSERDVEKAKIRMEMARTQLEQTREKIEHKQLTADISGRVTFVDAVKAGDLIEPHRSLVGVSDPNDLRLVYESSVPVTIADVQVGHEVEILYKGKKYTGEVLQAPSSAPETNDERLRSQYNRMLYISFDAIAEEAGYPSIGEMADIKIVTSRKENALIIPRDALSSYQSRYYVQMVEDGLPRQVSVEVGILTMTQAEIVDGLQEGQEVILGR